MCLCVCVICYNLPTTPIFLHIPELAQAFLVFGMERKPHHTRSHNNSMTLNKHTSPELDQKILISATSNSAQ